MRQNKRNFIEKVTFITTPGYLDGYNSREESGLPKNTGPLKVITQLAVYGFDEETKRMRIDAIHPGVTLEEIKENSSFEFIIPENIPTTEPPTEEDMKLLRELDPMGMAIGK